MIVKLTVSADDDYFVIKMRIRIKIYIFVVGFLVKMYDYI